jgi:phosphopantetheinyl transferase (holo-ACP synthase)
VRGRAARLAQQRGVSSWHVSISHTDDLAVAVVAAE